MFSTMRNRPGWDIDEHFGQFPPPPQYHHRQYPGFEFEDFPRDPRQRHSSGSSGSGNGSGEERVIPIQIIRDDSPKPPQQSHQFNRSQNRERSPGPPPIIIREKSPPKETTSAAPSSPSNLNAPIPPHRSNTEPRNPLLSTFEENRSARARSAPPGPTPSETEKATNRKSIPLPPPEPKPMQNGTGSSKNLNQTEQQQSQQQNPQGPPPSTADGFRSIPIIIEGRKSASDPVSNGGAGHSPPQPKVSRPTEHSPPPPPPKKSAPAKKDPLDQVNAVLEEMKELEKKVDEFKGSTRDDREYLLLDEMLTRCLIKLDVVETDGRDDVRTARKDCIKNIQSCISKLEKKTGGDDDSGSENMEMSSSSADEAKPKETDKEEQPINSLQAIPLPPPPSSSSATPEPPSEEVDPTQEPAITDASKIENEQKMEIDGESETVTAGVGGGDEKGAGDAIGAVTVVEVKDNIESNAALVNSNDNKPEIVSTTKPEVATDKLDAGKGDGVVNGEVKADSGDKSKADEKKDDGDGASKSNKNNEPKTKDAKPIAKIISKSTSAGAPAEKKKLKPKKATTSASDKSLKK